MDSNHPDKQKVRDWMKRRNLHPPAPDTQPIPTPEEIRRELGWGLTDSPQSPSDDSND